MTFDDAPLELRDDEDSALPIIDAGGEYRVLGHIPPPPGRNVSARPFGAAPLVPESEWVEFDLRKTPGFADAVPVLDQNGKGACFPPGTRIRMADGTNRKIEDVRLLDSVVTAEGRTGTVVRTMVRQHGPTILKLNLWGHSHLRLTDEHPVLTKRGYVKAGELRIGDWVALPRYMAKGETTIQTDELIPRRSYVRRERVRKFNAPLGRNQTSTIIKPVPDFIDLTPGFGRLLGLYLAEGASSHSKIVWTFGAHEAETLVADAVRLIRSEWNLEPRVQPRPNNSINVVVDGVEWAKMVESLCLTGSAEKRLAPQVTGGPRDFQEALFDAWLDGDGHHRRGHTQGVTISRDLALGMFDIANALGRAPGIRWYHSQTYGTVKKRRARWEVTSQDVTTENYRYQQDETHAWRSVRGIEQEEYSGPVFNLEVEGDNSYVAEGIGVHNCNGHAAASSLMAARFLSGQTPVKLSPWYVYAKLCGGIDAGSNIGDALRLLQSEGTCRFESVPYGTINPRRIPDQAEKEAAGFKIEIGRPLTTFAEMMSAAQLLRPFNFSIRVGGGFNNLDSDGCPPVAFGPGNHAVCGGLGAKRMRNGKWAFLWLNSWTPGWGDGGFAWVHEGHFVHQSYFEAYDIEAPYDLSGDPLNPPIAI